MARRRGGGESSESKEPGGADRLEPNRVVPGEIVLALTRPAAAQVLVSLPNLPARRAAFAPVTALGIGAVDEALEHLDVISIVKLHGPIPTARRRAIAENLGLERTLQVRYRADLPPETVAERLAALAEVEWSEPNHYIQADAVIPNDPMFQGFRQWGLRQINCPQAWEFTTGEPSVVVGVIDTGIQLNHPDLAPLLLDGYDFVHFDPGSTPRPGWVWTGDFTGFDSDPTDDFGHGTHVGGTICSLSNNNVGGAGVAWNVRLMPMRFMAGMREIATGDTGGMGTDVDAAVSIVWASANGARILNMSFGSYTQSTSEQGAIDFAVQNNTVLCAAMGNDNTSNTHFPSAYPGVIAVGATGRFNQRWNDNPTTGSNFGPYISLCAPGVDIWSTYAGGTYASMTGTSMATPHVAGVAALMLSVNPNLTATDVADILRSTALPLRDNDSDPVPNDNYGHGLVQADKAVWTAMPQIPLPKSLACQVSANIACQPWFPSMVDRFTSIGCRPPRIPRPMSLACGYRPNRTPNPMQWNTYDPYGYDPYGATYE
jgi:subtilisin family serine protease